MLKEIESARKTETQSEWKISAASLQSPLTLTISSDAPNADGTVRECLNIFDETEKSSSQHFQVYQRWTQRTLVHAKDVVSVLNDGVSRIVFAAQGIESVSPTQRVAASVDYYLAPVYEDFGSFEGHLETLSVHKRTRFNIYEPLRDHAIACYFPAEKLDEAHAAFNKRVSVSGRVKYNRLGNPTSIFVESIHILGSGKSIDERIDITGGTESGRYSRGLRDAK